MLTPAALTMPLAAAVYRFRGLAALLALVGSGTLFVTHRHSTTHPTGADGLPRVWNLDRASTIALRYPPMTETLRGVDLVIPTDATILALVGENDFVYRSTAPGSSDACTQSRAASLGATAGRTRCGSRTSAAPTGSSTTAG